MVPAMSKPLHFRIEPSLDARINRAAEFLFDERPTVIREAIKIGINHCRNWDWKGSNYSLGRGWESDNTIYLSVRCPPSIVQRLDAIASRQWSNRASIARAAL